MIRRRILYVAFEFPPLGGGGVQRSLYFTNLLPEFDIDPVVITSDLESFQRTVPNPIDEGLCEEISEKTEVIRIPTEGHLLSRQASGDWRMKIRQFLTPTPDGVASTWEEGVKEQISGIINSVQPDAILVSVPFFSLAQLWQGIAKARKIPFILDLRDAWSQWCIAPYFSRWHYLRLVRYERKVISDSMLTVTTSEQTRQDLFRTHPELSKQNVVCIPNGYPRIIDKFDSLIYTPGSKVRISYVGSFYYHPPSRDLIMSKWWQRKAHQYLQYTPHKEDWLYRSPHFFLAALKELLILEPELADKIEVSFAGKSPSWLKEQIQHFGLASNCKILGYLSRSEAIKLEERSDFLLLTSAKLIGGRDYSIAGKTFEYFERRKPILSFVCEGAQKDLLEASGCALILDPDSPRLNAEILQGVFKSGINLNPNDAFLQTFSRKNLSGKLAEEIHQRLELHAKG